VWHLQEIFILDVQTFSLHSRWLTTEFGNLMLYRAVTTKYGIASVLDPRAQVDLLTQEELVAALRAVF
jgi:hypothetical protein